MANRRAGETRAEKNEIRRLLFMGLSYEMVMLELKIPRSTFYRYLSQIQKEDEKLTLQAQSKGMDTMANWAKEQLMKSQLNLANMANNKTYEPRDRIASEALR